MQTHLRRQWIELARRRAHTSAPVGQSTQRHRCFVAGGAAAATAVAVGCQPVASCEGERDILASTMVLTCAGILASEALLTKLIAPPGPIPVSAKVHPTAPREAAPRHIPAALAAVPAQALPAAAAPQTSEADSSGSGGDSSGSDKKAGYPWILLGCVLLGAAGMGRLIRKPAARLKLHIPALKAAPRLPEGVSAARHHTLLVRERNKPWYDALSTARKIKAAGSTAAPSLFPRPLLGDGPGVLGSRARQAAGTSLATTPLSAPSVATAQQAVAESAQAPLPATLNTPSHTRAPKLRAGEWLTTSAAGGVDGRLMWNRAEPISYNVKPVRLMTDGGDILATLASLPSREDRCRVGVGLCAWGDSAAVRWAGPREPTLTMAAPVAPAATVQMTTPTPTPPSNTTADSDSGAGVSLLSGSAACTLTSLDLEADCFVVTNQTASAQPLDGWTVRRCVMSSTITSSSSVGGGGSL